MTRKIATGLALAALLTLPLPAAAATYTIDAAHSEAGFQIRHLVTKVRGQFDTFAGTIHRDTEEPGASSVTFTVEAASINTRNGERDQHLRSEDFFHVEEYPQITFESTRVVPTGESTYDVTGNLTMRGVTKEITLPVTFLGEARDPWGNTKAGFETAITLNRKDFGINWNAALDQGGFILGDEVQVHINIEALKEKPEEEAAGE